MNAIEKLTAERDEALRVRDLARAASNRDLEAKREAEQMALHGILLEQEINAELRAQIVALEADKAALDWLEQYGGLQIMTYTEDGKTRKTLEGIYGTALRVYGPSLRAAIDAARGAK